MSVPSPSEQEMLQEEFLASLRGRLDEGRREYGDATLMVSPEILRGEIEQELLDVAGWAYVLWVRVKSITLRDDDRSVEDRIRDESDRWLERDADDEQEGVLH